MSRSQGAMEFTADRAVLETAGNGVQRDRRRLLVLLLSASLLAGCLLTYTLRRFIWIGSPPVRDVQVFPVPQIVNGRVRLSMPNGHLVGLVGAYDNELTAYLRFQYLRSLKKLSGYPVYLTVLEQRSGPEYRLYVGLPNDLATGHALLLPLIADGYIADYSLHSPSSDVLQSWAQETQTVEATYNQPVRDRLLTLPRRELRSSVARFILFKVQTDRRVRRELAPADKILSHKESLEFAADMIEVADFYSIPLPMLLGIGAMENNYLDIKGDLQHSIWKRRAQRGDIVLRRRRGRVLVRNTSQGPWQITRETLRYAHALYLRDKREYTKLPARLRPPRSLNLEDVSTPVLTTYAGLLLRHLLNYFDGDVAKAEGAYNGGAGRPNPKYAQGVSLVATYARQVLGIAARRNGEAIRATRLTLVSDRPTETPSKAD